MRRLYAAIYNLRVSILVVLELATRQLNLPALRGPGEVSILVVLELATRRRQRANLPGVRHGFQSLLCWNWLPGWLIGG